MSFHSVCSTLMAVAMLGSAVHAQTPAPQPSGATFHSTTEMVLVPVIVTRDGKHVSGLKKESFVLLEDGKEQSLAGFEEVVAQDRKTKFQAPPAGYFTNAVAPDQEPARVIVLLLDMINTSVAKQAHARAGVIRYLSNVGIGKDPMMIVVMRGSGLHIIHDFTADPAVLIAAVRKLSTEVSEGQTIPTHQVDMNKDKALNDIIPGFEEDAASAKFDILNEVDGAVDQRRSSERAALTLGNLQQLARYLAGVPGRKTLIWATEGIRYVGVTPDMAGGGALRGSKVGNLAGLDVEQAGALNDEFPRTWDLMAAANVAVYPIDLEEVVNPAFTGGRSRNSSTGSSSGTLKSQTMNGFPDQTGGSYCQLQAQIENCYRAAVDDSAEYYLLSFYPTHRDKPGSHKLQVKVAADGTRVRARAAYSSFSAAQLQQNGQSDVPRLLSAVLDSSAIPIAVHWDAARNKGGKAGFELRIDPQALTFDGPAANHFRLKVITATGNAAGKYVATLTKALEARPTPESLARLQSGGLVYTDVVDIPRGTETVRFIVFDDLSGRIGTVTAKVASQP